MGLGKVFVRQAANSETRAAGSNFESLLTLAGSYFYPTTFYNGAFAIPGVARSVQIAADLLASIPWDAYRQRAGKPVEKLSAPALLNQPFPQETRYATFRAWATDYMFHGNAFGIIASRDLQGYPTSVYPVSADLVSVRRVLVEGESWLPVGALEYRVGGETYSQWDVIHIKGPCRPGDVRGYGALELQTQTLDLSHELANQAQGISTAGVPTGVLKSSNPDLTPEQAAQLKTSWLNAQKTRNVAVLDSQTEFTPLSWNPEEMQLLESRKFALTDIALIFGIPLSFLGADQGTRTYSNVEQEALNLIKFGAVGGMITAFEQTLSLHFPNGTYVKANLDAVLRSDTLTRYQAHEIGIRAGFLTVNEARELEDRAPLSPEELKTHAATQATGTADAGTNDEDG
ncbi:phage portal protein [Amycolatopsis japonica]|uniref:phage portal protein n=1 Tax=Amycolatopsis japonica TaxID=208439 RepID=UPI0037B5166B